MKSINSIDLNADLGEFQNKKQLENELNILKYISSCSIACGGHIGDSESIKCIISACKESGVAVGPHPSYPDKRGFGRKAINMSLQELEISITSQIQNFLIIADSLSVPVSHIKLHGKLYNEVSWEEKLTNLFLDIVKNIDESFSVIGPANSLLESKSNQAGISFISEAFIDRRYREDYRLVDRNQDGALLHSIEEQVYQAKTIVKEGKVLTDTRKLIKIKPETLCIHGDSLNSAAAVKAVCSMLKKENINIQSFSYEKP